MSWHVGHWAYLAAQSVVIGGAVSYYSTRYWLAKERLAHAATRVAVSEARMDAIMKQAQVTSLTMERNHLAEVLRHCTCASSTASSPWPRHAYTGKLPDE